MWDVSWSLFAVEVWNGLQAGRAPRQALERYLAARRALESGAAAGPADGAARALDALHALTSLRACLASGLASGARRPAGCGEAAAPPGAPARLQRAAPARLRGCLHGLLAGRVRQSHRAAASEVAGICPDLCPAPWDQREPLVEPAVCVRARGGRPRAAP